MAQAVGRKVNQHGKAGSVADGDRVKINPNTFVLPTIFLTVAAMLLLGSTFLPYWQMDLFAPQYPQGLHIEAYINRLAGDIQEVDTLNHYIGMPPLGEAAQLERSLSLFMLGVLALLVIAATFVHSKWVALLALPVLVYPAVFLLDLHYWLNKFGHNLDPNAPLSNAIKPFTPVLLGVGKIGQFKTESAVAGGFYVALLAGVTVIAGLYFHKRAYEPLSESKTS